MLATIPSVGSKTGKLLLNEFGSIGALVNASVDDISKVKGIGRKTAERIKKFVK